MQSNKTAWSVYLASPITVRKQRAGKLNGAACPNYRADNALNGINVLKSESQLL